MAGCKVPYLCTEPIAPWGFAAIKLLQFVQVDVLVVEGGSVGVAMTNHNQLLYYPPCLTPPPGGKPPKGGSMAIYCD